jgi:hypothetical protein
MKLARMTKARPKNAALRAESDLAEAMATILRIKVTKPNAKFR